MTINAEVRETGVLGVLGGMGPLASAAFVRTVYELNCTETEQQMPRLLLDSDPTVPDRSAAIAQGREQEVVDALERGLRGLLDAGATRTVIACMTAHHFLSRLSPELRARVVSLVDIVAREVAASVHHRHLMFATSGSRTGLVYEQARDWDLADAKVVLPEPADQAVIHGLIYRIKRADVPDEETVLRTVDDLMDRYRCTGMVVGCTEFHLYARQLKKRYGEDAVIDALYALAADPLGAGAVAVGAR
jgi:aspartate racemase